MKNLFILLLLSVLVSCDKKKETIEGELYFKLVGLMPNNGMNQKQIDDLKTYLKRIQKSDNKNEIEIYQYFTKMDKNDLLTLPHINIKTKENVLQEVFLTRKEYQRVKNYTLNNLNKKHKKILLELESKEIDSATFFSDKIISIKEVDGESPWSK